jgi:hypothetical protein
MTGVAASKMPKLCCRGERLFQENNGGKNRDGEDQHEPLKIVALEPAGEVQNQDDNRDGIKSIKHGFSPEQTLVVTRQPKSRAMIHEINA